MQTDRKHSFLGSLDWWTIGIYLAMLVFGWLTVCGASHEYGEAGNLLSLDSRSGMQVVWMGTALCLGFVILMMDSRVYDTFAYVIYAMLVVLLFVTIFNPHEIKGSRSWLVMGPLRIQPAEFAKFATALAVAKLISTYNFAMSRWTDFAAAIGVVVVPMVLIVCQKEMGSALVYFSFFLMLYREGMPGSILFTGVAMVLYFVVGLKYQELMISITPTSVGKYCVLLMIQIFSIFMVRIYCKDRIIYIHLLALTVGLTVLATLFAAFVIPFDVTWVQLLILLALVAFYMLQKLRNNLRNYAFIALFSVGSLAFFYSADYVLNHIMKPHQRERILVTLGLEEDIAGVGYNVHQSEIAIGSGGLWGKGFLNGTQTKLKYVPEQETDFIFCTVGEEQGFLGSAGVLMLYLVLILRLIALAERQTFRFGRVYGYCVAGIFIFHVFINVGMVLGLTPVIGIPLPFFSYGGSSLWGFTILLFIFLRIDASRFNRQT